MEIKSIADNHRILIVDDSPAIHDDFKKILVRGNPAGNDFEKAEASLFGPPEAGQEHDQDFELVSALQGEEALGTVREALKAGRPFSMAFMDVRMPPGWDGIETTKQLWQADPDMQIILCTAYSDYSWKDLHSQLGVTDRLVILKKPFDSVEVLQLANALSEKWTLLQQSRLKVQDLEHAIGERTRELQTANEQLRGTQAKLKHFLSNNPAVLYSFKFEAGNLIPSWVSDNFANFTGLEIQDWYQQTAESNCVLDEDRLKVSECLQTLLFEDRVSLEYRIRRRDAVIRWVHDDRQLLRDDKGQPVETIGCWTDITERKQLEGQLLESQKMEALGQLAGGVAHDFNNLLTIIQGYVCVLQEKGDLDEDLINGLAAIAKAADRAANLTRQLLTFTRRQIFQPRLLDLNEVIVSTSEMMQTLVGANITLETHLLPGRVGINADQYMMEHILINLAANSRDAMPKGGHLVLSTSLCEIKSKYASQNGESQPTPHVCLSVTDTGCGIASEHLHRIFEPFFTTKEVGKGTGLGLASVYGIVKQHQGWIETMSSVGKGTTFRIYFPVSSKPAIFAGPLTRVQPSHNGNGTILTELEPVA